ncbi:MAG: glycosyltransferase family 39 protein [Bdellovibrio sp.]
MPIFWGLALLTLLKLIVGLLTPLSPDEAYYFVWSQNLQLSYFDHPPFVAWIYALSSFLTPQSLSPRLVGIFMHSASIWMWLMLFKDRLSLKKQWMLLFLLSLSPLVGLGSWIITPDTPLVFFWSMSTLIFSKYQRGVSSSRALLLGLSLGFGLVSKYHMILFPLSIGCHVLLTPFWRKIPWKHWLIATCGALISFSPVLIWNFQNSFASFTFQLRHGLAGGSWESWWTLSYVAAQILILDPGLIRRALRADIPAEDRFLLPLTWVPLAFFLITSFRGLVEANWPLTAHLSFYALVALATFNWREIARPLGTWSFIGILLFAHALWSWIPQTDSLPAKIFELRKFEVLVKEFEIPGTYASTYQMASWIWEKRRQPTLKLIGMSRWDFFDELQESKPPPENFRLVDEVGTVRPHWLTKNYEARLEKKIDEKFEVWRFVKK